MFVGLHPGQLVEYSRTSVGLDAPESSSTCFNHLSPFTLSFDTISSKLVRGKGEKSSMPQKVPVFIWVYEESCRVPNSNGVLLPPSPTKMILYQHT